MNSHRFIRPLSLTAAMVSLAFAGGCVSMPHPSPEAPVDTASYTINTLSTRVHADIETLVNAFDTVMEGRSFTRTAREEDDNEVELTYRGPGDVGVFVDLENKVSYTVVDIRYGLTGKEYQSREILAAVVDRVN